jgi:hypothetical protein
MKNMDQNMSNWQTIRRVSDLPGPVQHDLEQMNLADADEAFSSGCVIKPGVASSRLIWAALSADGKNCVVHYECGGFVHTYNVRQYRVGITRADITLSTIVPHCYADLDELEAALQGILNDG